MTAMFLRYQLGCTVQDK